jgi:hypothetical protein
MRVCHPLLPLVAALLLAGCSSSRVAPRTVSLGERVELGHIIYTVFDTQWLTHLGEGVDAKIPQNRSTRSISRNSRM